MARRTYILVTAFAVFFGVGLCFGQSAQSQSRAEYERRLADLEAKLDALSKERAGEYLDVLERLYDVLDEYSDYMKELAEDADFEGELSLQQMKKRVREGTYADQPEQLLDDIYALIDEIKPLESQLRVKYDSNDPKGSRVLRNFRRELIIIAELVEDYTDQQMSRLLKQHDINDYIKTALESAMEALAQVHFGDKGGVPAPPEVPSPPEMPTLPRVEPRRPPGVNVQQETIEKWRRASGDRVGRVQTYQANMSVGSSSRPVIIENTLGDLIITGWDDQTVSAVLGVEVSASSGEKEREFISRTTLKVEDKSDGYHVYSILPRIADVKTEVLRSRLEVNVPAVNRVVCTSAYGEVSVTDLGRGVTVNGDNCQVVIDNVAGTVEIQNKKGELTLSDIRGNLTLRNSYAPITVEGCDGQIEIENANSTVVLSNNRGRVTINGSGQVTVSDHTGDVSVGNSKGPVEISEIEGNVSARNAYSSLSVHDVNGEVQVENSYGSINLLDIIGIVSANNTAGSTILETVGGPIDVTSRLGAVSLMLDADFRGRSSVKSFNGTIQVKIAEPPDMTLLIHTTGGTITSNLPIKVFQEGINRSAEYVLGEGGETLDLSGTNSSIIISGRF